MAEAVLLAASVAVLLGTVAGLVWRVRNPVWLRDAQLTLNASPRSSMLVLVSGALVAALVLALGIFWVAAGHIVDGWAMVCLAATGFAHVSVSVWIRRQPFP
jgi:hypothetical protein